MKNLLSILLALALLVASVPALSEAAEDATPLPGPGEVVHGFEVIDCRDFPLVNGQVIRFEHQRTGAQLMYIANADNNRVFDLTFNTQAIDNTGLPHVFEHATLAGSDKYPSKALWFNLSYQSYNTFMNAFTYQIMTSYPIASLSEAQLLKFADFYTDCCLHPMVLEDESIFREEAWRYRMASEEDPLTLEGTVYSEMLGAMTLERMADYNAIRDALPGSYTGNVSGGDPAFIPDMTFEGLKAYHALYYHPSNCVAYLYGHFDDYTAFLAQLDEAFSPYERAEIRLDEPNYAPITGPVSSEHAFPVEAGSDTVNAATAVYSIVCPGLRKDPEAARVLNTLTSLLSSDSFTLVQTMRRRLPTAGFSCSMNVDGPDYLIQFTASKLAREDADTFRGIVDDAIAEVAANGFPKDMVEAEMAGLELSTRLAMESAEIGVNMVLDTAYYYAATGIPFGYIELLDSYDHIEDWNDQGLYAEAAAKWLQGSELTAMTVTWPEAGLKEQQDAELAERLQAVKADMSDDERAAVIAASSAPDAEDPKAAELVAQLQAVTVDSLPEEYREYDVTDETGEDGVRYIDAAANVDGIGSVSLFIDAADLPQEDLHWFHLFVSLTGELDTSGHTREELDVLISRYLYGIETRLSQAREGDDYYHPRMRLGWIAMDDDQAAAYDLMHEIVYDMKLDDAQQVLENIRQLKSSMKASITSSPYSTLLNRGFARTSGGARYQNYYSGLDYYDFLVQAEQLFTEDPEAGLKKLRAIRDHMNNATGAIAAFAGSPESAALNRPLAAAFMAKLDRRDVVPVTYDLPMPAASEALIVDAAVQYNMICASFDQIGLEAYTADLNGLTSLVDDAFLLPMLRDQYGAYGVLQGAIEDNGMYICSYRDPNIAETYNVYEQLPELLENMTLDQDTLNGYVLSTYTGYALSEGELAGAGNAINCCLEARPQDEVLDYMRQLKAVTPDRIRAYADLYRGMLQNGYRATAGGAAAINANADLYETILNPFGTVDKSQQALSDVAQGNARFEAIRYAYDNGLMTALEDGSFGVDAPATAGDLAAALYALSGGPQGAPEEAVQALAGYGILWEDADPAEPVTGETCDAVFAAFADAVGMPAPGALAPQPEALTRADLAEALYGLSTWLEEAQAAA